MGWRFLNPILSLSVSTWKRLKDLARDRLQPRVSSQYAFEHQALCLLLHRIILLTLERDQAGNARVLDQHIP